MSTSTKRKRQKKDTRRTHATVQNPSPHYNNHLLANAAVVCEWVAVRGQTEKKRVAGGDRKTVSRTQTLDYTTHTEEDQWLQPSRPRRLSNTTQVNNSAHFQNCQFFYGDICGNLSFYAIRHPASFDVDAGTIKRQKEREKGSKVVFSWGYLSLALACFLKYKQQLCHNSTLNKNIPTSDICKTRVYAQFLNLKYIGTVSQNSSKTNIECYVRFKVIYLKNALHRGICYTGGCYGGLHCTEF